MDSPFEEKIRQQIERLQSGSLREIEQASIRKRIAWFEQHPELRNRHGLSPREGYERLFSDYMGLDLAELPVIAESETEIVWRSLNACPTLEACRRLGLDTRVVCRAGVEKPTQTFLSQMDPQLRFLRSYRDIRPHADYCLEWIVKMDFEAMMQHAIREAKIARQQGNRAVGAVVALGNRVLAEAHDTTVTQKDPGLHAEVNAIRQAVQALGESNLSGAVLFSTREPCLICASLAVWANLTTIVYGASGEECQQEIVEKSPIFIEVIGGVLREECINVST